MVAFFSGLIGGILAIIVVKGVRSMLAPTIIRRKLIIGGISKSIEFGIICWYIPIHVKANSLYVLAISKLDDVRASVTLLRHEQQFDCLWINPGVADDSRISLRIGTEHNIGIAEQYANNNIIRPYGNSRATLSSEDEDIQLELRYRDKMLGRWLFQNAIIGGIMQEVVPIRS